MKKQKVKIKEENKPKKLFSKRQREKMYEYFQDYHLRIESMMNDFSKYSSSLHADGKPYSNREKEITRLALHRARDIFAINTTMLMEEKALND